MISCWLVDYCPQRFSFRYIFRSPMCYFCFFFFICTDAMHWIRDVISIVSFCCFRFSLPREWPAYCRVEWYLVIVMIWCLVCLICVPFARYFLYGYIRLFALQFGSVDSFINRLVDWSINPSMFDWLVDRPIDRLIHSLIGWLLAERLQWFMPSVSLLGSHFQCLAPMNAVTRGSFRWSCVGL